MSKVWYCFNCGYEVTSRGRCHQCKQKFLASPLPELAVGDEDEEVGYRLADWEDANRGRLIHSLVSNGILHRFEEDELVVALDDEERVDELVAAAAEVAADGVDANRRSFDGVVRSPVRRDFGVVSVGTVVRKDADGDGDGFDDDGLDGDLAGSGDVDEGVAFGGWPAAMAPQLQLLRDAALRLQADPTDMEADGDVAEASAAVFVADDLIGVDPEVWAAVGRTTRRLLGALGAEEAQEDEIMRQASILNVLLDDDVLILVDASETDEEASAVTVADDDAVADSTVLGGDVVGASATDDDADDDDAETVYELPDWLPEQRAELTARLNKAGIASSWDHGDLVVPVERESEVEELFEGIGGVSDPDAEADAQYRQIEELFAAASRLAGDPADPARATDFLRSVPAVEGTTPLGFDGMTWSAIRKRGRVLADSIEHKANPDVVSAQAVALRDLLREIV
jgi:hypothetical protein